jgi:hypothetical protein
MDGSLWAELVRVATDSAGQAPRQLAVVMDLGHCRLPGSFSKCAFRVLLGGREVIEVRRRTNASSGGRVA